MRLWYRFSRLLFRIYFRLYHRGKIYHAERLPKNGGIILAANHISFLDPPFLGAACEREAFYMARDTLFRHPIAGAILRSWNCVPINRDRGDIGAIRTLLKLLKEQKAVLMFPEGTRSHDGSLQQARAGIGMIVARASVPVIPMRIFGTGDALPRGKSLPRPVQVSIVFGEPFKWEPPPRFHEMQGDALKDVYREIGQDIMKRVGLLKPNQNN